ncbi:MAG: beta-propeller fold lactonase family protein, partial [Verrucomicrobiales bacterium]|nr:beta-propeller fold lactonase family protein [Verrucomicrobiales bacterium]
MVVAPGCVRPGNPSRISVVRPQHVGRVDANRYVTPNGQILTPAGRQVELPGLRPQALALRPGGKLLAVAGRNKVLVLIDPETARILQKVQLSANKRDAEPIPATAAKTTNDTPATITAEMSFTGLVFSPDGTRIYLSNTGGNVWAFPVDAQLRLGPPKVFGIPDANAPNQKHEIPTGLAVSTDGRRLYVAGNLGNRLHEVDTTTGQVLRSFDTGVAPHDVALAAGKAYVSNLGGPRPEPSDLTAPAGKGTKVRVDPIRHIALEGSVTVIDLASGSVKAEIPAGFHASALAVSPGAKYVVVANSGSDTLNVIDTRTDRIVEKIWTRRTPADLFGAQPNALAFDRSGRRLYACNGTQNAVAVIAFEPEENASAVVGMIPVGWFPGAIQYDAARKALCVANLKGIGATKIFNPADPVKLNTKDFYGTVSLVPVPSAPRLTALTRSVLRNIHYPKLKEANLPARTNQPARPVPDRVGEPSVFQHVVYVIKENRTYDQILGDMPEGNGDPDLCIFGEKFTPNQHKLAREFVLLDNTYCAGVQSADGHQWVGSAIANEYVERQLTSGTPRSYPGGKDESGSDALAWASSGFLWDNALAHGKTIRNYGEWMISEA